MDIAELLEKTAATFERLNIPYFVTGSMASMAYGEPRLTNDVDIVVSMTESQVRAVVEAFPSGEYYADEEIIREAIRSHGQFNIIHPSSGLKVDVVVCPDTSFNRGRFSRIQRIPSSATFKASFASPEDLIVKKMDFYKAGGSEKHLRDITGILKVSGDKVDRAYIERWAVELGLEDIWRAILKRLGE